MTFVDTAGHILNRLIQYLEIIQLPIPILLYIYIDLHKTMIFLKEEEKKQIQTRIKDMNPIFKNHKFIIFMFQALGTAILSYGISVSQYTHPIKRQHPNIYMTFLVSCFLYLGIAVAAPFTGGHLNPSVTIGVTTAGLSKPKQMVFYIISQIIGALIGVLLYFIPFYSDDISPPQIYSEQVGSSQIILDAVSEFFGTFIFLFGIIYACKRSYANGQYFKYLFIVMMLLLGRTKGCLNPAVGIAFQIFAAFRVGDAVVFFQIWGVCLGSILGGVVAAWFFNSFYEPLLDQMQNKSQQAQQLQNQ